jgi:hypothetical protein
MKLPHWISLDEPLPPWTGDDNAMLRWLGQQLKAMKYADKVKILLGNFEVSEDADGRVHFNWIKGKELANAIDFAEHGDVEPLRKLYPDIAEFINLPKRARGKRFKNSSRYINPILGAAQDARRIRMLWKKFYPEFYPNREKSASADWFAAQLWSNLAVYRGVKISEQQVANRVKKL